ncbi:unnamed protein product [Protopolystoma xenopodis]|uniref:Uncharacterized protein n=1 Tax=Protopolystoma xenopodis TaxID=117903 RepID=A0A448XDU9_9PLAT|nr:unnamed protein product [Protopolystoma xenopodis]
MTAWSTCAKGCAPFCPAFCTRQRPSLMRKRLVSVMPKAVVASQVAQERQQQVASRRNGIQPHEKRSHRDENGWR